MDDHGPVKVPLPVRVPGAALRALLRIEAVDSQPLHAQGADEGLSTPNSVNPTTHMLPSPETLTWDQSAGRACVWCKRLLTTGAVFVGVIPDRLEAHVLDTKVWAGPCCSARST